jgi:transcriptional regulator
MYSRAEAKEERNEVLFKAMRDIRLGTLVVADDMGAPQAAHVPFVLKTGDEAVLECHVARANPIWKLMAEPRQALVIFQGPQAYVRPGWYPAKKEHGKVVPTWSYVSIHARGLATQMDMPTLLQHVRELSDEQESGQPMPWSVDDAPAGFIEALARGIVGLRLPITSLDGVWKLNQHRSEADRHGMIEGLDEREDSDARSLASIMRDIEAAKINSAPQNSG